MMLPRVKSLFRKVRNKIVPYSYGTEHLARPAFEGPRNFVFLCGCGRSGTTALAELVSCHSDVAIGDERFAGKAIAGDLEPGLFTPERFKDFRPEDGCHTDTYLGDSRFEPILHKLHAAKVIGDKVPTLFRNLDQLERFPDARVVFIVREPFGVAKSFTARARNAEDRNWDNDHDYRAAVAEFNEAIAAILAYRETGKPSLVLDYDGLFQRREGLDELWSFMGVDAPKEQQIAHVFENAHALEKRSESSAIGTEVSTKADFAGFRKLTHHYGVPILN